MNLDPKLIAALLQQLQLQPQGGRFTPPQAFGATGMSSPGIGSGGGGMRPSAGGMPNNMSIFGPKSEIPAIATPGGGGGGPGAGANIGGGAATGATVGAAVGGPFAPITAAIGAIIGAIGGAVKEKGEKQQRNKDRKIQDRSLTVQQQGMNQRLMQELAAMLSQRSGRIN